MQVVHASNSGAAIQLEVTTYSDSSLSSQASRVAPGGTLFVDISLVNQAGAPVIWNGPSQLHFFELWGDHLRCAREFGTTAH